MESKELCLVGARLIAAVMNVEPTYIVKYMQKGHYSSRQFITAWVVLATNLCGARQLLNGHSILYKTTLRSLP